MSHITLFKDKLQSLKQIFTLQWVLLISEVLYLVAIMPRVWIGDE